MHRHRADARLLDQYARVRLQQGSAHRRGVGCGNCTRRGTAYAQLGHLRQRSRHRHRLGIRRSPCKRNGLRKGYPQAL